MVKKMTEYATIRVEGITDLNRLGNLLDHHNASLKNGVVVAPKYRVSELRKKIENNGYGSIIV